MEMHICRLCLESGAQLENVYNNYQQTGPLEDIIKCLFPNILLELTKCPQVCQKCLARINDFEDFKAEVTVNEAFLLQSYKKYDFSSNSSNEENQKVDSSCQFDAFLKCIKEFKMRNEDNPNKNNAVNTSNLDEKATRPTNTMVDDVLNPSKSNENVHLISNIALKSATITTTETNEALEDVIKKNIIMKRRCSDTEEEPDTMKLMRVKKTKSQKMMQSLNEKHLYNLSKKSKEPQDDPLRIPGTDENVVNEIEIDEYKKMFPMVVHMPFLRTVTDKIYIPPSTQNYIKDEYDNSICEDQKKVEELAPKLPSSLVERNRAGFEVLHKLKAFQTAFNNISDAESSGSSETNTSVKHSVPPKVLKNLLEREQFMSHSFLTQFRYSDNGNYLEDHDYLMSPYRRLGIYNWNPVDRATVTCNFCNLNHKMPSFSGHMLSHARYGNVFRCCSRNFDLFTFNEHLYQHNCYCTICRESVMLPKSKTTYKSLIEMGLVTIFYETTDERVSTAEAEEGVAIKTEELHICETCFATFNSEIDLDDHRGSCLPVSIDEIKTEEDPEGYNFYNDVDGFCE